MATKIFPSTNDVAPITGGGKVMTEANLKTWVGNNYAANLVITDLTASAGSGLNLNVAAGNAMISGRWVNKDAQESVTLTDNTTNYVFLKLTLDGSNNVTGAVLEANTTGTPPADSVKIAQVVTSGGVIQQVTDYRDWAVTMKKTSSGGISAVDRAGAETALARLADPETITGNWTFAPTSGGIWFNADSAATALKVKGRSTGQNEGYLHFYRNDGTTLQGDIRGDNAKGLVFRGPSATDDLIIGSGGLVGIGISSLGPRLHINVPNGWGASAPVVRISNGDVINAEGNGLLIDAGNGSSDYIAKFQTRIGTDVMMVRADGSVGIGTVTPDTTLHVYKRDSGGSSHSAALVTLENSTDDIALQFLTNGSTGGYLQYILFGDAGNNAQGQIVYNHNVNDLNFSFNGGSTYPIQFNPSGQIVSNLATGTAPFSVASTTKVTNLNADMVDGSSVSNTQGGIPLSDTNIQTYLNAGYVKDYEPGNAANKLAINNGTVNTNLNAEQHNGLKVKVVDIGDWNMNSSPWYKNVAHGLTLSKIRAIHISVRNDTDTQHFDGVGDVLGAYASLRFSVDGTNVFLEAPSGGQFSSIDYDSTSYNRGWITIWYVP